MKENNYNPDVLNCIANLSNDEVFTPPELANKMLDLLPQELFRSPKTTFLDPFTKSGVFLRALLWNLLQRALQLAVPMCIYLALGGQLRHAGVLFASQCLVVMGYAPVPIPGAMGVADYLMVDAFSTLGFILVEDAIRLEMLSRGLMFYLCVAASGLFTLLGDSLRRKREIGNDSA